MSRYVEVDIDECKATTDKAALLVIGGEDEWIPWSQIEDNGEPADRGWSGVLYLTQWICEQKDIEYSDD